VSHGYEIEGRKETPALPADGILDKIVKLQDKVNSAVVVLSMIALIAACLILTGSVFLRYFLKVPTDWQDEVSVFLLIGAIFMCGAFVQAERGHIGISAIEGYCSPLVNRLRLLFCDVASFAFCTFFSYKSWSMLHEAVVEGQTSSSSWAPPMWIPYGLMSTGMTLLCLQLLMQIVVSLHTRKVVK
jgi:TRAP-type C4-dicarboxylate transport system permease small subunit